MSKKSYTDLKITTIAPREIEMEGEITVEVMEKMYKKALGKLKETAEMDGFRKGNVPEHIIIKKIGDMGILEEASEMALNEVYPEILEGENIDAIGRPEITITKMAPGNPLSFKIKTSLAPEIKIADYKKIAQKINTKKEEDVEVSEKEIDEVVLNIRKNIAHMKMHEHEEPGSHDHSHGEIKDEDLPEINEQFLKDIGGFATVEEFRSKIKENMISEKTQKAQDKKRTDILEEIIKESTIEIPEIIIDAEHQKMLAQFKDDIARTGVDFKKYMTHIKKTEADLKKEWSENSKKRAESQIILNTITREEGLAPEETRIKEEMEKIIAHFKDAERFRVRMYVETFLANDMVFAFLDAQK